MATDEEEKAFEEKCRLLEQGFSPASCAVWHQGRRRPACRVTLKWQGGELYRLIKAVHLSRPEHYFSIYQSGCNWSCKKCHSWEFTQYATGDWVSPEDIAGLRQVRLANLGVFAKTEQDYKRLAALAPSGW